MNEDKMEIRRKNVIERVKVKELKLMSTYLILDSQDKEQILFINCDKKNTI
jgi:hypothetical protein